MTHEYIFKFIIIGDMGVGKSCLLHQFTDRKFLYESPHTIGVEFGTRVCDIHTKLVKLQIWDTAGQERFRAVTRSYYRGAAAALLIFDITRRTTYNHLSSWLTDARNLTNQHTVLLLVGNKVDLDSDRQVSYEEAERFALDNGLFYMETSAKDGKNVEEAFLKAAYKIYENISNGTLDPNSVDCGIQYGRSSTVINHTDNPPPSKNCNC